MNINPELAKAHAGFTNFYSVRIVPDYPIDQTVKYRTCIAVGNVCMESHVESQRVRQLMADRAATYCEGLLNAKNQLSNATGNEKSQSSMFSGLTAAEKIPQLMLDYFSVSVQNRERTLKKMFLEPNVELSKKALDELIALLISTIPLASLVGPVAKMAKILRRGKDEGAMVANYLDTLDDRSIALLDWAKLTEDFNVAFEFTDSDSAEVAKISAERVANRLMAQLESVP